MLDRFIQCSNTLSPRFVTLLGIVTLVRLSHPLNANVQMLVTLSGIENEVSFFPAG